MNLPRRTFIKLLSALPFLNLRLSTHEWSGWFARSSEDEVRRGNLARPINVYDPALEGRGLYILGWDGPPNHEWVEAWNKTTSPYFGLFENYLPVVRK